VQDETFGLSSAEKVHGQRDSIPSYGSDVRMDANPMVHYAT